MKINCKNHSAFTLIEMILAIGVAAIVLVAVNAVLFTALHLRDVTGEAVDAATPMDQAMVYLRRDLQCAVTPTNGTSKVLSGDFKVGNITSASGQPAAIEMYTATGALSDSQPWGDIQCVNYGLRNSAGRSTSGMDLVRIVTRNLLATTTTAGADEQLLLSGVESIKFSCYDGAQWNDTWDTTGLTSVNTNLPLAVRVYIQMAANNGARPEPIEILVPIDSQSRTNRTTTGG